MRQPTIAWDVLRLIHLRIGARVASSWLAGGASSSWPDGYYSSMASSQAGGTWVKTQPGCYTRPVMMAHLASYPLLEALL
jgi:hypothetical protein